MKIKITKLEAARHQLKQAIELWFNDGDLMTMHLLACSAHQVISDIGKPNGHGSLIYDSPYIVEERRKEFINIVKGPYNHLKHADRDTDPEVEIELNIEVTEIFILFTIMSLVYQGIECSAHERAFFTYHGMLHPENYKQDFVPFEGYEKAKELALKYPKHLSLEAFKLLDQQLREANQSSHTNPASAPR